MWMRRRTTWSSCYRPVKFRLNKDRGRGVTILGAIGECLPRMVTTLAYSTNREAVVDFLRSLRSAFSPDYLNRQEPLATLVVVLDNHRAHITSEVAEEARQLKIELLFLPPYCPELNSIEALWAQVKKQIKDQLIENTQRTLQQHEFEQIIRNVLNSVT